MNNVVRNHSSSARSDRQPTRPPLFLFATGVENSYPTIQNGRVRRDEMEECGHYRLWERDFDLLDELGIRFLRYGPPLYRTFLGQGQYDWEFADQTFARLKERDIVPIVDLCHFGVPDWIGTFQNPDFPALFAEYASAFAHRFPWVQLYTPVNEMFICATFSAATGYWNEQLKTDQGFVTALKHIVRANVLAMYAILEERPDAIFIQSESSEYFHPERPQAIKPAEIQNARRFLSLDLNYGRPVNSEMHEFLLDNGMTREEYHFFLEDNLRHHCIMGNDFYHSNEHRVDSHGQIRPAGEVFGYDEITRQYHDRYGLPVMHTETNFDQGPEGDEAIDWLWKQWANVLRVRNNRVPIVGFTWYSLTDQIDWDVALREQRGHVNPRGLFDLDRNIRPVGEAYKRLLFQWREVLPTQSVCLFVPVVLPSEYDEPMAVRRREGWRRYYHREMRAKPRAGT
ncbi:family 1 glycosylhydrolase [Microvirga calopogonii]|uniref:family 1 glycosylhydrolase n=1 Tax=Microvirga calopogonii TaxID=2078013 RepID=UPI000E0D87A8|nr:family 1 glycosylhydrolase [Microvirga calopogonii]